MSSTGPTSAPRASILSLFLLLTGVACGAAAVALSQFDWITGVEGRIQAARGDLSDETRTWLQGVRLPFYAGLASLALFAGSILSHFQGTRLLRVVDNSLTSTGQSSGSNRSWRLAVLGVGCLSVFAFYPVTLVSGYFRYDDFDLISMAATRPLADLLLLPHGDHVLPLTRVLAHGMYHLFGVSAAPYNALILLCMAAVLYSGSRVLAELGTSRGAQILFIPLMLFWTPWAELMTGYYILSTYLLIALLSLVAYLSFLRWQKSRQSVHALGMVICCLVAPLIDISGGYVLAAIPVFLASDWWSNQPRLPLSEWLRTKRPPLIGVVMSAAVVAGVFTYAYLIAHPGSFLGMASDGGRSWLRLPADLVYVFTSGVLASMVMPFVYARIPVALLAGVAGVVLVVWFVFTAAAYRRADRSRKSAMVVMVLLIMGTSLMVILGRPSGESFIVRWAAKHVCPIYIWTSLLLALSWDTLWTTPKPWLRQRYTELTFGALGLFFVTQQAFGLLGMAVAFPPFGYAAEIRDAIRRKEAVKRLEAVVIRPFSHEPSSPVNVPILDGEYIKRIHPSLFSYNLANYFPFFANNVDEVTFVRTEALQRHHANSAKTVPSLRDAVPVEVVEHLLASPSLRSYYFGEVPLSYRQVPKPEQTPLIETLQLHGGTILERSSDRVLIDVPPDAELVLKPGTWDPETAFLLTLGVSEEAGSRLPPRFEVVFTSAVLGIDWRGELAPTPTGQLIEIDLRQAYAFSLSREVGHLRLRFPSAGRFWLYHADVSR